MHRRVWATIVSVGFLFVAIGNATAQDKSVKIGVLTDLSGLYSDQGGIGSVVAAQMAVEDSGMLKNGWTVGVVSADHQNKPDIGSNLARQWIDVDGVDVITDVLNSGVALAVNNIVRDKNRIMLNTGAASSDLTNAQCTPNTVHWTYDTYMLAHGTGRAVVRAGGGSWFFLSADYAFGAALERDTEAVIRAEGGKVLGNVKHPVNTSDFSSFLLQAQASRAKIIGLANAGNDTMNAIKQASEFGIVGGEQRLAALLLFISDVHALGLDVAQGLNFTETFYWDMNESTREFARRFQARMTKRSMPTMVHAGTYAALLHYFKALRALGGNPHDGVRIVAKMKDLPTDDALFGVGKIQPNGRALHPAYLFEVKKPSESRSAWDYYKTLATIPADEAFTPLSESVCPLARD